MESTHNTSPTGKKTGWLVGGALLAILAIVYFSFFYPPTPSDEVTGTIGAAKKYRSDQISENDVRLADRDATGETAAIDANIDAFDRMEVAAKTSLVSKTTQEAREALFAAFSAENATAILDRTPIEALKIAVEKMNAADRDARFFALMPALDRAKIALKAEAADVNAAYAALDLSAKDAILAKVSAASKADLYQRSIAARTEPAEKNLSVDAKALRFEKMSPVERSKVFDGMKATERTAILRSLPVEAAAPLAEKIASAAFMKTFFTMSAVDQRAIVGRMPVEGRMHVYATLPVDAKMIAFKSLPVNEQKIAFDQLSAQAKSAFYKTIPVDQRSAIEGKAIPLEGKHAVEGKTSAVPNE